MIESAASRPMFPRTRSWGGAGSAEQPRLLQGGTPPGTTATAGTAWTSSSRKKRGSIAAPAPSARCAPTRLNRGLESLGSDSSQHQRRADPRRLETPFPPCRRGRREAHEDDDLRPSRRFGEAVREAAGVILGREDSGGFRCVFPRATERAFQYRTRPGAQVACGGFIRFAEQPLPPTRAPLFHLFPGREQERTTPRTGRRRKARPGLRLWFDGSNVCPYYVP